MKIGLIRHFPVQQPFLRGWVTQEQVLQWFTFYNEADILPQDISLNHNWEACYSSDLKRARETAVRIFRGDIQHSHLLNEPAPDPVFKSRIRLPFLLWALIFRGAILGNHNSQSQQSKVIRANLENKLHAILNDRKDTLIVGHVFTMEILSRLLIKHGFSGKIIRRPKHGQLYLYEKLNEGRQYNRIRN